MKQITVYRYIREGGGVTVSPNKPNCEYTEMYRLIADEGMAIKKGDIIVPCADVTDPTGWIEVDAPEEWTRKPEMPGRKKEATA